MVNLFCRRNGAAGRSEMFLLNARYLRQDSSTTTQTKQASFSSNTFSIFHLRSSNYSLHKTHKTRSLFSPLRRRILNHKTSFLCTGHICTCCKTPHTNEERLDLCFQPLLNYNRLSVQMFHKCVTRV